MWLALAVLVFGQVSGSSGDYGACAPGAGSRTLKLDVSVDPTIVVPTPSREPEPAAPHTSTVRITLTNPGPKALRLTFPDPCFLGYRVETRDGTPVPSEGSSRVCFQTIAKLDLAPGAKETKELRWTARTLEDPVAPLPAGTYRILGTLQKRYCDGPGGRMQEEPAIQTAPVTVEVRPAAN